MRGCATAVQPTRLLADVVDLKRLNGSLLQVRNQAKRCDIFLRSKLFAIKVWSCKHPDCVACRRESG